MSKKLYKEEMKPLSKDFTTVKLNKSSNSITLVVNQLSKIDLNVSYLSKIVGK